MRLRALLISTMAGAALLAAGCGDDDGAVCGAGTERRGGVCEAVLDGGGNAGTGPRAGNGGRSGGGAGSNGGLACGEGTVEQDGECVPDIDPAKKPVGAGCVNGDECGTGTCLPEADNLPGGMCTVIQCGASSPCPVGSACYKVDNTLSICMAQCNDEDDCRTDDDYHCQPLYTEKGSICTPSCVLAQSCPAGTRCNEDSGLCDLAECDLEGDDCTDSELCWPDEDGVGDLGGLCLDLCDPSDPDAVCLVARGEVCQPLAEDPTHGFCAPPVCTENADCPAGATCEKAVCLAPASCSDEVECEDDSTTCVSGNCMPKCPTEGDASCGDIHPGLICADVLDEPACLPVGSFPGSACRPDPANACDGVSAGNSTAPMICQGGLCLADCAGGGTELCAAIDDSLVCAVGIFDDDLCLPKGSFPGAPCGPDDSCAQDLEGNEAVDMKCVSGTCLIDCDEDGKYPGYGDALCEVVDAALTCSAAAGMGCVRACDEGACDEGYSCFDAGALPAHENACLPNGSFPGSPCAAGNSCAQDLGGNTAVDMACVNDTCVVTCAGNNDELCAGVSPTLTCAESAGNLCVLACGDGGACPTGYSCLDPGGDGHQNACLPNGSFPGSPCAAGDACAQDLGGNANVDMQCVSGTCVVSCPGDTEAICTGVSPGLTCSESAGNICVPACVSGQCLPGNSCLDAGGENACLPNGSFPGSACGAGNTCAQDVGGNENIDMECANGICAVSCSSEGLCDALDPALTCSPTAGGLCVLECDAGDCPEGYSCLLPGAENACLPTGSFPSSPCRETPSDECDQNLNGIEDADMVCLGGSCMLPCPGDDDALCGQIDPRLTCFGTANVCTLACDGGSCPTGFTCVDPGGENSCIPN